MIYFVGITNKSAEAREYPRRIALSAPAPAGEADDKHCLITFQSTYYNKKYKI
jgi:hypothetical protein